MNGRIEPGVLPSLLPKVYLSRRTGTLHFASGPEHCDIRFVKGHVVYGGASERKLHMGEVLVAQELLSQENLDRATELVVQQHLRLGQALQNIGVVDQELLEDFLAIHVREILRHVFSWRQGFYSFEEQDPELRLEHDFPLKMPTGELIMEAARRIQDRESVLFALGDLDRVLLPATEALLRFQHITLTPIDGFVLSRLDGTLSAREILQITPLDPQAVERSLFALVATGVVEYAARRPQQEKPASAQFLRQEILDFHAALRDRNHFELLGISKDATDTEIKAAYLRRAKRYHPDVHHQPALGDLQTKLEAIFSRLSEANRVLSDREARAAYRSQIEAPKAAAAPLPRPRESAATQAAHAEEMSRTAEEHFAQGRYWEAIALLVEVVRLGEGRTRQKARLLLARAYLKHPDKERLAEKELLAVLEGDPRDVDAHFYLGTIYRRQGLLRRARTAFEKVLELRPSHREAIAELGTLKPKPEPAPESQGLLGKLFRK